MTTKPETRGNLIIPTKLSTFSIDSNNNNNDIQRVYRPFRGSSWKLSTARGWICLHQGVFYQKIGLTLINWLQFQDCTDFFIWSINDYSQTRKKWELIRLAVKYFWNFLVRNFSKWFNKLKVIFLNFYQFKNFWIISRIFKTFTNLKNFK